MFIYRSSDVNGHMKKKYFKQDLIDLFVRLVAGVGIEFYTCGVVSCAENGAGKAGETCTKGTGSQPLGCYE